MIETEREKRQAVRIRQLLDRVMELEEQVQNFEEAMLEKVSMPLRDILTKSEGIMLGLLMDREMATKSQLMAALYGLRHSEKEVAEEKIVDVFVCKMRRKLKALGIEIKTHWGSGYSLPPESKTIVGQIGRQ